MTFDTFWAALVANLERRGGLDMSDPSLVAVLTFPDLKEMLGAAYELGREQRDGT